MSTVLTDLKIPSQLPSEVGNAKGNWPRMLKLSKKVETQLADWLYDEIWYATVEKEDVVNDWMRWQEQYWAEPETAIKTFPFYKAANVVVPLTAIAVEAVHARMMNTLFAVEPFWSIRPRSKSWVEIAPHLEKWLQVEVEEPNSLNVYEFCNDTILEGCKLGTMIGKSGYRKNVKKTNRDLADGGSEPVWITLSNGATLEYVPCANFLMRAADQDPQEADWCGEEHSFTWGQLKRMSSADQISPKKLESIKMYALQGMGQAMMTGSGDEYKEKLDDLQSQNPIWHHPFKIQEIWAAFDIDGDGYDEEIVIDYHWESKTILSIRHNWYEDLHRPYRITQYVKVEGRWMGIGIGKQNEQFQIAITTIHRQRLDNATLANMRMMAVKKGSGISPDEPIFPGKLWFVDDPKNDIVPVQMSDVYSSASNNEMALLSYSERRTGVNEVILGIQAQGTPGTATGDLARLSEGNKRFDLVLKNIRWWLGLLGQDVISNYQQYGNQQLHWLVLEDNGQYVEQFLNMPREHISKGAIIELSATSSVTNRQAEQQQWLGLFSVVQQYYGKIIELAMLMQDPQILTEAAVRATKAADYALLRLLQAFGIVEPNKLLLLSEEERRNLIGPASDLTGGSANGSNTGGGGGLPAAAGQPGLAALATSAQGPGAGTGGGGSLGQLAARGVRS